MYLFGDPFLYFVRFCRESHQVHSDLCFFPKRCAEEDIGAIVGIVECLSRIGEKEGTGRTSLGLPFPSRAKNGVWVREMRLE